MKYRRYKHKMPHFRNTTFNMGELTPIGVIPVIRGETFRHNTNMFMRINTLVNPVMHPVNVYIRHYYIPNHLVWENWRDFISGGEDNDDASVHPTIDFSGSPVQKGSLANHLGLPVGFAGTASALPFRAYNLIYNEYVRDDQLQAKVAISLSDGADSTTSLVLLNDNWAKDPFVSARPDDQLGTDVTVSLGSTAPIAASKANYDNASRVSVEVGGVSKMLRTLNTNNDVTVSTLNDSGNPLYADLSKATGISLTDLALAIQTGKLQEIINRRGNDYHDFLRRYGINYSDARLDRPEYLGGGKQTVQFSEVLATAEGTNTNVGDMAGHGIAALRSNRYMSFFEEDGFVISLACVKPIPMYMQSVQKFWYAATKEDYYQREYEVLGMQEIKNKQVQYNHSSPDGTFGYEPRYDDMRRIPSTVHGEFAALDKDWHYARDFSGDQALNSSFITCSPTNRVYADTTQDQLRVTVQHQLSKLSPLSKYSPLILSQF